MTHSISGVHRIFSSPSHRIWGGGGELVTPPTTKNPQKMFFGSMGGSRGVEPETLRTYAPTLHHTFQSPDLSPHTIAYHSTWFTPHVHFMTCHSTCCSYITPSHPRNLYKISEQHIKLILIHFIYSDKVLANESTF